MSKSPCVDCKDQENCQEYSFENECEDYQKYIWQICEGVCQTCPRNNICELIDEVGK